MIERSVRAKVNSGIGVHSFVVEFRPTASPDALPSDPVARRAMVVQRLKRQKEPLTHSLESAGIKIQDLENLPIVVATGDGRQWQDAIEWLEKHAEFDVKENAVYGLPPDDELGLS